VGGEVKIVLFMGVSLALAIGAVLIGRPEGSPFMAAAIVCFTFGAALIIEDLDR
jgi:hypothetical protein